MSSRAPHSRQAIPAARPAAPPPALPSPFAALAAELRLHRREREAARGPTAALQALILALLARLFGRLDAMFHAWQQGQHSSLAPARPIPQPGSAPRTFQPSHATNPSVAGRLLSHLAGEPPARIRAPYRAPTPALQGAATTPKRPHRRARPNSTGVAPAHPPQATPVAPRGRVMAGRATPGQPCFKNRPARPSLGTAILFRYNIVPR